MITGPEWSGTVNWFWQLRPQLYLLGQRFTLRTDHNSLLWLMGFKNIEGQLARWIVELAVYNMEIVHRPGKDHVNADGSTSAV